MNIIILNHKQTQEGSHYIQAESLLVWNKRHIIGIFLFTPNIKLLLNTLDNSIMWTDENSKYKQQGDNTTYG